MNRIVQAKVKLNHSQAKKSERKLRKNKKKKKKKKEKKKKVKEKKKKKRKKKKRIFMIRGNAKYKPDWLLKTLRTIRHE